jgi:cytochrome c oxidase cbb3-type subunit III
VFLWSQTTRRVPGEKIDTTGHVWDEDLQEWNNPLPRWWMWLFVITVVFSAIYLALYPGLGAWDGGLKWSSTGQYEAEQERAREAMAPLYARYAGMSAEQLAQDAAAMGIGQRLFLNNCAQCHGSDARGSKGFPNLTDGEWQWGGSHEAIVQSITQGRVGNMPALGAAVGTGDDVRQLAHYVLSLSGGAHNPTLAQLGAPKFAVCAACHGADGKGNQALGAPDLTNGIWLHGGGEQAMVNAINNGFVNVMPAQDKLLTAEQIHVLAAYVWQLSRPTPAASE